MENIDADIKEAILVSPTRDPKRLAAELTSRFRRVVPASVVVQVRGSMRRAENVENAKTRASETLGENLDIMGNVKNVLLDLFNDESLPLKDRMEVSKELRMWTKEQTAAAGIQDAGTNTLFVISSEWSVDE